MSRITRHRCGTIRLLEHEQWIVKNPWYGDVRFKQRAVTEFFMAEKGSVTNILKQLNYAWWVYPVDKVTESPCASHIAGSEKGQTELGDVRRYGRPTATVT